MVKLSDEARVRKITLPGGMVQASVGPKGRLVALSDGPGGRGYLVCDWCGWAAATTARAPRSHDHLLRVGKQCNGKLTRVDLAHRFETDLLSVDVRPHSMSVPEQTWQSVLYAMLEAASSSLEIARDDIGGTVRATGPGSRALALFDTVPGGGGNVLRIEERLEDVLKEALRRVENCECGPETSCYGCLRGYRNQREHDQLSRGAAADLLKALGV